MISIDTNVLVRFLVDDEPRQAQRSRKLLLENTVSLSQTVLLEAEWVLRFSYSFSTEEIHGAFVALLGMPNIQMQGRDRVQIALEWYYRGMDFADALHLANAGTLPFRTFDKKLIKKASRFTPDLDVSEP